MKRALASIPNTGKAQGDKDAQEAMIGSGETKNGARSPAAGTTSTSSTQENGNNKRIRKQVDDGSVEDPVDNLLSYLTDASDHGWKKVMEKHFRSASFRSLALFVDKERKSETIYPSIDNTWTALNFTPLEEVRVVIVGQDPYHGVNQAHGLCFSVLPSNTPPPSLMNIYKELANDADVDFPRNNKMPNHGHLIRWAQQGVLLLNNVLTVRKGQPNSHKRRGWEEVTDAVIRSVDRHCQEQGRGCVFLLWGKPATTKALQLIGANDSNADKQHHLHTVIATSHPSPLGARKTSAPFWGSRCFSRCNEALVRMGHESIDWNVD